MRWWDGARWTEHTADWSGIRPAAAAMNQPILVNQPTRLAQLERERKVAPWLRGLLLLWPIAVALSLGGVVSTVDQLAHGDADSSLPTLWWVGQLGGLVGIAVSVLRIIWLYRAATLARSLGLDARREPMHAAIGWLIPIINYWWPYQGVTDLFPPGERPDRRIAWWWTTSIVSQLTLVIMVAVPFVPTAVAVVLVALALAPAVATAALEVGLIGDAQATHERLMS
jgi:hypothetical protein